MRAATMTHVGKVRPHNEDCVGLAGWLRSEPMTSALSLECRLDEPRLCLVSDGLGGHAGGEIASAMVTLGLAEAAPKLLSGEDVVTALSEVNKVLYDEMDKRPGLWGMGATVVGLLVVGSKAWLFNVGDSRGYLRIGPRLRLLTIDDNTAFGKIDVSERTSHPGASITQSLGGMPEWTPIEPHVVPREIEPGDRYLLCSDGLTDMLDLDGIERRLTDDARVSVEQLVSAALEAGGEDNVSVMILDFLSDTSEASSETIPLTGSEAPSDR
jgi:serine/threonine protein phosphatase PrpC